MCYLLQLRFAGEAFVKMHLEPGVYANSSLQGSDQLLELPFLVLKILNPALKVLILSTKSQTKRLELWSLRVGTAVGFRYACVVQPNLVFVAFDESVGVVGGHDARGVLGGR